MEIHLEGETDYGIPIYKEGLEYILKEKALDYSTLSLEVGPPIDVKEGKKHLNINEAQTNIRKEGKMASGYYIAVEDRTEEVIGLLKSYREPWMPLEPTDPSRVDDLFFIVGCTTPATPSQLTPIFTLLMRDTTLDSLESKTRLYSFNETRELKTIGDLREYLASGDVEIAYTVGIEECTTCQ